MTARSSFKVLTATGLLAGAVAVLILGTTLARHVVGGSHTGLWLFAWAAGFAVLLPVGVTLAAVLGRTMPHRTRSRVVPNAGWNIPGAGQ